MNGQDNLLRVGFAGGSLQVSRLNPLQSLLMFSNKGIKWKVALIGEFIEVPIPPQGKTTLLLSHLPQNISIKVYEAICGEDSSTQVHVNPTNPMRANLKIYGQFLGIAHYSTKIFNKWGDVFGIQPNLQEKTAELVMPIPSYIPPAGLSGMMVSC